MSTSALSVNTGNGSPISFSGLASGLNTSAIVTALLSVEKVPITRLTNQQEALQGQQTALQGIQSKLQQLAFAVSEFTLTSSFESSQTVTSSEPLRVAAATSSGAGVGGYEVEVTQLANSAQRTYTFTSPTAEDTLTIGGRSYTLKAGGTAQELAAKINSDASATVYAAVTEGETLVLSSRATGATSGEAITVSDPGGALSEKAGTAKEGKNAEFKVDGVAGSSNSNTVTSAIAGVTLTLAGTTPTGPVTIVVQAPGLNASSAEAKLNSFVTLYNTTVETIEKQLTTKPPEGQSAVGAGSSLFGDRELSSLLTSMRESMYEPIAGLTAGMTSPFDIGLSTGPAGSGANSQATLEGKLTLEPKKLLAALQSNPAGVEQMLQKWSQGLQGVLNSASEPGGTLETRISGDGTQITELKTRIATMNEMLAVRQKALQATYAELEGVLSKNNAQSSWLTSQSEQLTKSGL